MLTALVIVLGVLGFLAGWAVGSFLVALRDDSMDVWGSDD